MGYADPDKQRAYQNEWVKRKRRSERGGEVRNNKRKTRAKQLGAKLKPIPRDWEAQQLVCQRSSCHWCGAPINQELVRVKRQVQVDFECDHVIPLSEGGEHSVENMVLACINCNGKRGGWHNSYTTRCRPASESEQVI